MRISAIAGDRRTTEVRFGDDADAPVAHVTYDPTKYTPALEAEFAEIADTQFQSRALVLFVSHVIVEWDLEDDEGPIALDEESVNQVPVAILARIIQGIKDAATPSSEEGKDSGGGSQQKERTGTSLSGTS